jgi:hypothetical protein
MTINVGLSKKIGLPDYGSLGATCNISIEADHNLLERDLDGFHQRVKNAFAACRQAVQDELARNQRSETAASGQGNGHANDHPTSSSPVPRGTNGNVANGNGSNGNGARNAANGHGASEKQLSYARQFAKSIQGLGIRRLETLANKMFGKPLTAMSSMDASGLIDTLKSIKAGEIDLSQVLEGTGT